MNGKVIKHSFYSSKTNYSEASFSDPNNVICNYIIPHGLRQQMKDKRNFRMVRNDKFFHGYLSEGLLPINSSFDSTRYRNGKKMKFWFKINEVVPYFLQKLPEAFLAEGFSFPSINSIHAKHVSDDRCSTKHNIFIIPVI